MLIGPVSDLLDQLEEGDHVVIVPDKQLRMCPFAALLDYCGKPLGERLVSLNYLQPEAHSIFLKHKAIIVCSLS